MVTWRCEYRQLLFFWPVACVVWWVGSVGSLYGMVRKVDVFRKSDHAPTPWRALLMMGYVALRKQNTKTPDPQLAVQHTDRKPHNATGIRTGPVHSTIPDIDNNDRDGFDTIIVSVELNSEAHLRWSNTAVQTVAVGIYLYATFVLSSSLFLTGQEAILYAVGMTLSLSAVRIMTALS